MAFRPDIVAGQAVILVNIQDNIDAQLRQIRAKLRRFSNSLSDLGGDLFRGGLLGTIGAALPVKDFMNFQDQMLFLQTKLRATDDVMQDLEQTVRDLGKSTSFTSREVAQGATELAKAEFSARQIKDALQAVLDLGRGAQIPLEDSASIIANTIKSFGLEADQAARVAGNFIAAARLGTIEVDNLKESLKESLGTFRGYGASLEETLALFSTLSFASLKGTKAGTSLNTMFLNLNQSSKMLKENLDIDVFDGLGRFRGVLPVLTDLDRELRKLTDENRMKLIQNAFNIRGGRAQMGLFIQGVGEIRKRVEAISEAAGEARWAAEKLDSALGGVWRRSLSALQELSITLGSVLEGPLTTFGENMRLAFNNLNELVKANPKLAQSFLLLPPAILAVGSGLLFLGWVGNKFASLLTPVIMLNEALFAGLNKLITINLKVGKSFVRTVSGVGLYKNAIRPLFTDFGPTAIRGIGTAWARTMSLILWHTDRASDEMDRFTGRLAALTKRPPASKSPPVQSVEETIRRAKAFRAAQTTALSTQLASNIIPQGPKGPTGLSTRLTLPVAAIRESTQAAIKSGRVWNTVRESVTGAAKAFRVLFFGLNAVRRAVFSLGGITTIIEGIIIFGPSIPPVARALDALGRAFRALFSGIADTFRNAKPALDGLIFGIKQLVTGNTTIGLAFIKGSFAQIGEVIRTNLTVAWNDFIAEIEPGVRVIKGVFKGVMATIEAVVESIKAVIGSAWETGEIVVRAEGDLMTQLKEIFSFENLKGFFVGVVETIGWLGQRMIELGGAIAKLELMLQKFAGALSGEGLGQRLLGVITPVKLFQIFQQGGLFAEGEDIAQKLKDVKNGIKVSGNDLANTIAGIVARLQGITEPIKPKPGAQDAADAANDVASGLGAAADFISSLKAGAAGLQGFIADPFGGEKASVGKGMLRSLRDALAPGIKDTSLTAAELGERAEAVMRDVRAEQAATWAGGWEGVPEDLRTKMLNMSDVMKQMAEAGDKEGLQAYLRANVKAAGGFEGLTDAGRGMIPLLSGQAESTESLFGQMGKALGEGAFSGMDAATKGIADLAARAAGASPQAAAMAEQMKPMELAAKSIVGSFGTTRGGMLATQKMEARQTALLQTIADNTTEMKDAEAVFP